MTPDPKGCPLDGSRSEEADLPACSRRGNEADLSRSPSFLRLLTSAAAQVTAWLVELLDLRRPHFDRYRPAPRLGTRNIEHRLLRRLHRGVVDTVQ